MRVEHVRPSRCKEEFLKRSKENDEIKHEAKQRGGKKLLPRCLPQSTIIAYKSQDCVAGRAQQSCIEALKRIACSLSNLGCFRETEAPAMTPDGVDFLSVFCFSF